MRSQRSTRRKALSPLAAVVIIAVGLTACSEPAPDPLLDEELRASATEAAEEAGDYLALIELPDATPMAAQEADFCMLVTNNVFGDPTPSYWSCGAYAIQVVQSPTDDLERLDELVVTALEEIHPDIRIGAHGTRREQVSSGDSTFFARATIGGGYVRIEVVLGRDSTNINTLIGNIGKQERLIASTGDELLTVPTTSATPVTCDCLQVWIMVVIGYGNVTE